MGGKKRRCRMGERVDDDEPDVVFLGESSNVTEPENVKPVPVSCAEATASVAGAVAGASSSSSFKSKGTKRKGKRGSAPDDDFVCLGESMDQRESSFGVPPSTEVIELVDSDDNDNAPEEGMKHSENRGFGDAAHVDLEHRDEQVGGSHASATDNDKAESFGDGELGLGPENPIIIHFGGGGSGSEEGSEDDESGLGCYSSDDTSDYGESSDEDFQADDVREGSSIEEDDSSSYEDEDGEEEERIRNKKKKKKKKKKKGTSSMDQERNVETESAAICKKNSEGSASLKKRDKQGKERGA